MPLEFEGGRAPREEVGRCEANEILWNLLSVWALNPDYQDLSNKTSSMVTVTHRRVGSVWIWMQLLSRCNAFQVAFWMQLIWVWTQLQRMERIWMHLQFQSRVDSLGIAFRRSCILELFLDGQDAVACGVAFGWKCVRSCTCISSCLQMGMQLRLECVWTETCDGVAAIDMA